MQKCTGNKKLNVNIFFCHCMFRHILNACLHSYFITNLVNEFILFDWKEMQLCSINT